MRRVVAVLRTVVLAAAAAGVVVGGSSLPDGTVVVPGAPRESAPAAAGKPVAVQDRALACPGQERLGVSGVSDPAGASAPATVLADTAPETIPGAIPAGQTAGMVTIDAAPKATALGSSDVPGRPASAALTQATSAIVRGTGSAAPMMAAAQSQLIESGDRRALIAAACPTAAEHGWLLGGAGDPGRQEYVVLVNPNATAVAVDLVAHGERGPIDSPHGTGLTIPAGGRQVVLLDALAPGEKRPAVEVTARGGTVVATLHDTWLDGITARGGDDSALATAGTALTVTGLLTTSDRDTVAVRVVATGSAPATVTARVVGAPKAQLPTVDPVTVQPGRVVDLPIVGLRAGSYAVELSATTPIAAAGFLGRGDASTAVTDFGWVPGVAGLTGPAGLPLRSAAGGSLTDRLVLAASKPSTVQVSLVAPTGVVTTMPVVVDGVATVDVTAAAAVWVGPGAGVTATVVRDAAVPGAALTSVVGLQARPQQVSPPVLTPARQVR